jgi:hypothetical protein
MWLSNLVDCDLTGCDALQFCRWLRFGETSVTTYNNIWRHNPHHKLHFHRRANLTSQIVWPRLSNTTCHSTTLCRPQIDARNRPDPWWAGVTQYSVRLPIGLPGFDPRQGQRFFFASAFTSALVSTQTPTRGPFGSKVRPGCDADHSLHPVPRSRVGRSYISSPPKRLNGL